MMISSNRNSLVFSAIAASAAMVLFACSGVSSDLLDAQPSGASGTSGDGGSNGDARTTKTDAGKVTVTDSGTKVDSGGGHPGEIVPAICGSSLTCNTTDPTCCGLQGDGITTTTSYTCTANDGECTGMSSGVAVECRDNSDCGGSAPICCGVLQDVSAAGGYATVKCQSSCVEKDTGGNLTANVIFCASSDACAADGLTCGPSNILTGFNVCGQD
ncbi:MAG: hypothetical protein ACRELY_04135 [Polyangiaceae bacterium]